jgi:hypothetical protein
VVECGRWREWREGLVETALMPAEERRGRGEEGRGRESLAGRERAEERREGTKAGTKARRKEECGGRSVTVGVWREEGGGGGGRGKV